MGWFRNFFGTIAFELALALLKIISQELYEKIQKEKEDSSTEK